jgi:hypothetical protein
MIEKLIEIHFSDVQPKKKAQILASSLCLFANNGYHGTSIMNIAKRANVGSSKKVGGKDLSFYFCRHENKRFNKTINTRRSITVF